MDLSEQAQAIDDLAARIEQNSIHSVRDLNQVVTPVEAALARYYQRIAVDDADHGRTHFAGRALHAAAYHLFMACADADENPYPSTAKAIKVATQLSRKMINDPSEKTTDFKKVAQDLLSAINSEFKNSSPIWYPFSNVEVK